MAIYNRTEEDQQRLNNHMRRQDVLERLLLQSLHAAPATEEQVKRFLATAPPEVFVLLHGFLPKPPQASIYVEVLHENRIVQGFVGMIIAHTMRAAMGPNGTRSRLSENRWLE